MMLIETIDAPGIQALLANAELFESAPFEREQAGAMLPADVAEAIRGLAKRQDDALVHLAQAETPDQFRAERELLLPRYRAIREALQAIWRAEIDPQRGGPEGASAIATLRRAFAIDGAAVFGVFMVDDMDAYLATAERAFRLVPLVNRTPLLNPAADEARDHVLKTHFGALTVWVEFHFNILYLIMRNAQVVEYRPDVVGEIASSCRAAALMYAYIREGAELRGFFRQDVDGAEFERSDDDEELLSHPWQLNDHGTP